MDNVDLDVLRRLVQWRELGHTAVLGTITRTWGSAPRPVGSLVAVRNDGQIAGSVSGGCIEDDLIERIRAGALTLKVPELVRYGVGAEEATRFGLPCGGTLELLLEPVADHSLIEDLLARLDRGERVRRAVERADGRAALFDDHGADLLRLTETQLISNHGPQWRLLVIGAGQLTRYLAQMALALDYQVTVCDPREEYALEWGVDGAILTRGMPDDVVQEFKPDPHSAVIALTHDPKLDDLALMEALKSPAFFVGAIGSRINQGKRRARLAEHFGLNEAELSRLHGPVGLPIGARTPPEIAIAILAELTAERYGALASGAESGCVV